VNFIAIAAYAAGIVALFTSDEVPADARLIVWSVLTLLWCIADAVTRAIARQALDSEESHE
jgi:hypothetical protein